MAEYAFTFGARSCLIKTYLQVAIGGAEGYIAFPFVVEDDRQSLRPLGDREGHTLSFFAQTEQGALAQASEGLAHRFGPRAPARDALIVASIRQVQLPALIDDQRAALTVLARETIRAGDYVVITDQGATPLTQTSWPGAGARLGRALEGIDAGHRGQVREVSPKGRDDPAREEMSDAAQRAWTTLQRYTGWLGHDTQSNTIRAAVNALGVALDERADSEVTAAALAKVSSEIERLHAVDLKPLFRNALRDLSVDLDSSEVEQ
jgi:hypothetical protein